jgi:hypothetical protein
MTEPKSESVSFDARVVLRPRTLDETLDLALTYMRLSAKDFGKLIAVVVGVASVIMIAIGVAFDLTIWQRLAVAMWLSPFVEQIATVYGGRHLFQSEPKIRPAIGAIMKRFPRVFFTSAMLTLPWTPMLLTNFKDPVWIGIGATLGTFWPFLVASQAYRSEVSLLEQLSMKRAGQRTKTLIAYRYARALGMVVVSTIVRAAVGGGVELTTAFILGMVLQFGNVSDSIGGWPAVVGYLLAGPYVAIARMFDYVDARTRREGWDIQVRFNAIAQAARDAEDKKLGKRAA